MAIDWHASRSGDQEYVRCTLSGGEVVEGDTIEGVTSFTLDKSLFTQLKATGTLSYVLDPGIGDGLVRIYHVATQAGETERVLLATMLADTNAHSVVGSHIRGTAQLYSVLRYLLRQFDGTVVVPAGTACVAYAAQLVAAVGLPCTVAEPSSTVLSKPLVYAADASPTYLDVMCDLLDVAGYASPVPDEAGGVVLAPYVEPGGREPVAEFSDDPPQVDDLTLVATSGTMPFAPEVPWSWDRYDVPNMVKVVATGLGDSPMVAVAYNDDPASPYSTVARGHVVPHVETVSEAESQEALQAYARRRLASLTSAVESVEVTHPWTPEFGVGDPVRVRYGEAGQVWDMSCVSQSIGSGPALLTRSRVRRFVR